MKNRFYLVLLTLSLSCTSSTKPAENAKNDEEATGPHARTTYATNAEPVAQNGTSFCTDVCLHAVTFCSELKTNRCIERCQRDIDKLHNTCQTELQSLKQCYLAAVSASDIECVSEHKFSVRACKAASKLVRRCARDARRP
jgi:hypothetical protein